MRWACMPVGTPNTQPQAPPHKPQTPNPKPPTEFYNPNPRFGSPEAAPSDIGCCLHVASNEDLLALAEQCLTANTQRVLGFIQLAVARPGNPRFGETQDPKP